MQIRIARKANKRKGVILCTYYGHILGLEVAGCHMHHSHGPRVLGGFQVQMVRLLLDTQDLKDIPDTLMVEDFLFLVLELYNHLLKDTLGLGQLGSQLHKALSRADLFYYQMNKLVVIPWIPFGYKNLVLRGNL